MSVPTRPEPGSGGPPVLVVSIQNKTAFFDFPLEGAFSLSDARTIGTWTNYGAAIYEYCDRGDWDGAPGDDVIVARGWVPTLVSPPTAPGVAPLEDLATVAFDIQAGPGYPRFDHGDWNGDGQQDLLLAWDTGDTIIFRVPPLPYPLGGAAIYLGPLPPEVHLLDETPAVAWYDAQSSDLFSDTPPHSGLESRLLDDLDGDGKGEVLLSGSKWPPLAVRDPPEPEVPSSPRNAGGFAVFAGGAAGAHGLGMERTLLAATCYSDQINVLGDTPTHAREVGDVDGDGIGDLVLLADEVQIPNGTRQVAFVVTRLPQLTGVVTYTEASGAVIVNVNDLNEPVNGFMEATPLGDLNRDGIGDFALSVHYDGVYVFLSPVAGFVDLYSAALRIRPNAEGSSEFGVGLAAGDTDGDGIEDLVISDDHDRNCCGAVHIVPGQAIRDALGL